MQRAFLFISAENDAIAGCKAGGMGDVVRDIPRQIAETGDLVHVVTPAYGRLHRKGKLVEKLVFPYRGELTSADLYEVPGKKEVENIKHYVIDHPDIKSGNIADIYMNDFTEPFFTDACTFSLFCTAVAAAIKDDAFSHLQIVHLHDWHTSLMLFLKEFHQEFACLKDYRFVYSIHNLAIQGIRPFDGNHSSLKAFYPDVDFNYDTLRDPRYWDCMNLMALGIRLADAVHTVSHSYKENIQQPSNFPHFVGGEGLEEDLRVAQNEGRLFGILNGCNYKNYTVVKRGKLYTHALRAIFSMLEDEERAYKHSFLRHTADKVLNFMENKPSFVCGSVARLTEQKFYFFKEDPELLENMLKRLQNVGGVYILLGTGAPDYEELFKSVSYAYDNFIFINLQSEEVIDSLYLESNLYLMPSLFEPCGISQMLAMRNGQPCLVHNTGGLRDTVINDTTGFVFEGDNLESKKEDFIKVFEHILDMFFNNKKQYTQIARAAKRQKFTWQNSIKLYYSHLYQIAYTPPKVTRARKVVNKKTVNNKSKSENFVSE
ncbi:starch synthase [Pustulibacterium marinum]|uniref:starch synthase n=1 Tax=Pustulibacterium marinum TaxID=1224947 RepID=A0A1I7F7I9_9FLAO|nr:glycogen/starch synthase [Pustulibacterium marinum]SFU32124.1 starch synthase [Pustulibacterium marinum]